MRAHPGEEVAFCGSTPEQNEIPKAGGGKGGEALGLLNLREVVYFCLQIHDKTNSCM